MRRHNLYHEFDRRWQLPVYFQLRWKEIVVSLEEAFSEVSVEPSVMKGKLSSFQDSSNIVCFFTHSSPAETDFLLGQTVSLWRAVTMCWSPEVLIPELSHRFWRLTLQVSNKCLILSQVLTHYKQLLNRYATWLHSAYATIGESNPMSLPTTSANPPNETTSVENIADDEILLQQYAAMISDLRLLENKIDNLWQQEIRIILPPGIVEVAGSDGPRGEFLL